MYEVIAILLVTSVNASPLLIWSQSGLPDLEVFPLGHRFGQGSLIKSVIEPQCAKSQVVVFDVPNLSFGDLSSVASNSPTEWPTLKSLLADAKYEKVYNYDGEVSALHVSHAACGDRPIIVRSVAYKSGEAPAYQVVDAAIEAAVKELGGNLDDVIFIVRSYSPVVGLSVDDSSTDSALRHLLRRSADALNEKTAAANGTDYVFVEMECMLFYAEKIWFQILGSSANQDLVSNPFRITELYDDGTECNDNNITLRLKAGGFNNSEVSDIILSGEFYVYQNSQWFVRDMYLNFTYADKAGGGSKSYKSLVDGQYVAAPLKRSYSCITPQILPYSMESVSANILFRNLQIDPRFNLNGSTAIGSNFTEAADCECTLSTGVVMGFAFTLLVLILLAYTISMFTSLKNPVFGDRTIVVVQE
jgi:hypothetical protein